MTWQIRSSRMIRNFPANGAKEQRNEALYMGATSRHHSPSIGGPACYSPWGRKELDMTEQLN